MQISRTTNFEDLPELMTPEEVQAFLGVGRTTIYALLRQDELPHIRFGRRLWVPKEGLLPRSQGSS